MLDVAVFLILELFNDFVFCFVFFFKHAGIMQLQEWPVDSEILPVMFLMQPAYAMWLVNIHTKVSVAKQCN